MEPDLAIVEAIASEAASIVRVGRAHTPQIRHKASRSDLVTDVDVAAQRAIVAKLRHRFPADTIVAEETMGDAIVGVSGRTWYVDPIDGTMNFAHGLPFFCMSIGMWDEGGPALAYISAPVLGWRFKAERGCGAQMCEMASGPWEPLRVSRTERLRDALLATGFPYDLRESAEDNLREFAALQRDAQAVRRVGSAALDLAMVAVGWFDGYWEQKLNAWDLAAGVLLVTEAGGRVSGYDGEALDYRIPARGRVVASNGHIHDELVAKLGVARAPLEIAR